MEGFSNRIKIEGMVGYYFSSCNSEQLKKYKVWDRDTHTHTHTHTHTCTLMHVHICTHMHTDYLDKSNVKKNQVCTGQASLRGLKMPACTRSMIKTIKS